LISHLLMIIYKTKIKNALDTFAKLSTLHAPVVKGIFEISDFVQI